MTNEELTAKIEEWTTYAQKLREALDAAVERAHWMTLDVKCDPASHRFGGGFNKCAGCDAVGELREIQKKAKDAREYEP